jgi:hypothetical protein
MRKRCIEAGRLVKVGGKDTWHRAANITDETEVASPSSPRPRCASAASTCWSRTPASPRPRRWDTTLEIWKRNQDILVTGYFLASRAPSAS